MDSKKKAFFDVILELDEDPVKILQDIVKREGLEEASMLAKSFNEHGETPLLLAIADGSIEVVEFLIDTLNAPIDQLGETWWDDEYHETAPPLFWAILCNEDKIPTIVNLLIAKEVGMIEEHAVLNSVLSSNSMDRKLKIHVLELIGAAYILKKEEMLKKWGMLCWIEALLLRQPTSNGDPLIAKKNCDFAQQIFGPVSEFTTFQKLTQMMTHQQFDLMEVQALLVALRIFKEYENELDAFHIHQLQDIWFKSLIKRKQYRQAIKMLLLILNRVATRQQEAKVYPWQIYFQMMFTTFVFMKMLPADFKLYPNDEEEVELTFPLLMETINHTSRWVCKILKRHRTKLEIERIQNKTDDIIRFTFNVVVLLGEMLPGSSQNEHRQFIKWLKNFNQFINRRLYVSSLLHFACISETDLPVPISLIQLLLDTGAHPDHTDLHGNPPIYFLSFLNTQDFSSVTRNCEKAQLLVDAGAHLDQVNDQGQSALGRFKKITPYFVNPYPAFLSLVHRVPRLTCRCAQVVRQNRIPFKNQQLPPNVVSFLKSHDADRDPNYKPAFE